MRVVHSAAYEIDLGGHVWPTSKYRLIAERLVADGLLRREAHRAARVPELTRDDMVDNTELLAMGAAAVEADPGSAAYWIRVLQKRGVVRPDLQ